MELEKLIEGYRLFCQAEGKSPQTIRWYMGKLNVFLDYLRKQSEERDVESDEVTVESIRGFITHLQGSIRADELNPNKPTRPEPLSGQTIQSYVRTIKAFFSWAVRENLMEHNPTKRVRVPKTPKTIVATLSETQVRQLLVGIDRSQPIGFRDYCIMLTLLDTGIRLSELVGMELPNLDLEEGHFRVFGKGSKERIVPVGANLKKHCGNM